MKVVLQLPVLVAAVDDQDEVVVAAVEVLVAHCLQRLPKQKGWSLPLQK